MPRATNSPASHRRKKRIFKQTKGFVGGRKNLLRSAIETLNRSMAYAFRDRRVKKRNFRKLWIARIGIAARNSGMSYNAFISGLAKANVELNRKVISNIAINDTIAFNKLVEISQNAK